MYPLAEFEQARLLYPGVKRGRDTEYENYLKQLKKHRLKESEVTKMICEKCGTPFDGKHKLCHECRSIYAYEGIPVRVVEEKPVVSKAKKTTPKAASPAVDTE